MSNIRKLSNIIVKLFLAYILMLTITTFDQFFGDFLDSNFDFIPSNFYHGVFGADTDWIFIAIYTGMIWIPFKK